VRVLFSFVGGTGHAEPMIPIAYVLQDSGTRWPHAGRLAEGAGNQSDALSAGQVHAEYDLSIMRTLALIFIANSDLAQLTSRMTKDQELRRYTNPSRRMPATPTLILAPDP